ncbi:MAG: hypothetical protein ABI168_12325 [Ginsengibacter sp.]
MQEKINYGGWPNCIRLCNDEIELIVTTDIGPRIIRFGFIGKQNLFYQSAEDGGKIGGNDWRIYGGHRLWLAPEAIPLSYHPDNNPVISKYEGGTLTLTQPKETTSGMVKEMEITLSPDKTEVTVLHRLINQNLSEVELSPWAISAMASCGRAIIPQEPYGVGNDYLLPARPLSLWHYTKMNDRRWIWGNKYIQAIQDPANTSEQKIGLLNKQGWIAYYLNGELLIKKFDYNTDTIYPDFCSNNEIYINGNLLEIETLGPLKKIPSGGAVFHTEHWLLTKATAGESEESIDVNILPIVNTFQITR